MFSRLLGLVFLLGFSYLLIVFVAPSIADQYGDPVINAKIRNIKDASLQFASGSDSDESIIGKIKNTATPYIKDTQQTVKDINITVTNKVNQLQDASNAVQSAYSGVMDATHKIQNLTGTGK